MKRIFLTLTSLLLIGCRSDPQPTIPDKPRLTPQVRVIDSIFHSDSLNREMRLRLVVPTSKPALGGLPLVLLLHGAGTDFHDWTNNSDIASLAAQNIVLVFPDAPGSYYIDEASGTYRNYENYITTDVTKEVYRLYPQAAHTRDKVAIVGISRGGYGATVIGLKHPYTFSFIGDVSGALDFPERKFRWRSAGDSIGLRRVFGAEGSETSAKNDPFKLIRSVTIGQAPYIYMSCGEKDPLFATNKRFASILDNLKLAHEFHELPGGHKWGTWGAQIPTLESALLSHFHITPSEAAN